MIKHDADAWATYPQHRQWFNKLFLAQQMGYYCGPSGTAPDRSGWYIVRPTYNLSGMGVGAKKKWIEANDCSACPPGYFWSEWFDGHVVSVTYKYMANKWRAINCMIGMRESTNLSRFNAWYTYHYAPKLPAALEHLTDVEHINVEYIADKAIEVHLRGSHDPVGDVVVPIWQDTPDSELLPLFARGYTWISAYDDADGNLSISRLGFMVLRDQALSD